ncbi:nucleoside diphosphate kinase regulator [Pistricoccus aurantiacus]|uniref:Nucleoside diphosphate kinase regulator n=1 Tax=Pistricoccus aurantiacus TaxID=1883414 RepID=A0A5B8SRJ1_9GAMM|nr:nucleoside diphosphate kinase regulator [Pistricoccus aurantiacus]QEA37763.1 nucleoside diphosphate kinase regulator [Pistricoccus aurantiacus]
MSSRPIITINRLDAERLQRLIDNASDKDMPVAEALEVELERGEVIEPQDIPEDVVSMNSQVQFTDLNRGKQLTRTLVYPHALAGTEDGLSVMAPIGAALLGLRIGDIIDWTLPDGHDTKLRIDAILWQPERAGQFHR